MKKLIIYISLIVLIVFVIVFGVGQYILSSTLSPDNNRFDLKYFYKLKKRTYPTEMLWFDSLRTNNSIKELKRIDSEGDSLCAYFVPSSKATFNTAIIIHGYSCNSLSMVHIAYLYHKKLGYNIFLPDLKAHGQSGGNSIQMGWKDRLSVIDWLPYTKELVGDSVRIVMHGISMGAATTMMVSGEKIPEYVKCFVEDCGYTSAWDEFKMKLKSEYNLSEFPMLYVTDWLCRLEFGWGFKEASALKQIQKTTLPMLFIHGDKDNFVPTSMVYDLYKAKKNNKELWIVPGAKHALSYKNNPENYILRVKNFVSKYMVNKDK